MFSCTPPTRTVRFKHGAGKAHRSGAAEVRPFYNFISKLTKRAKATQKDYAANEKSYRLLDVMVFSISYQCAAGIISMTAEEYEELIDFFLKKCLT